MRRDDFTIFVLLGAGCLAFAVGSTARAQLQPAIPPDVISALKSHGIVPTPAGLVIGLRNPAFSARIAALDALGRIGRYEHLSYVMAIADTRAPDTAGKEVRRTAILAAAQIARRTGGPSSNTRNRLVFAARDILSEAKTPFARLQAAEMLGQLGDASQYQIILDSLKAKDLVGRALLAVRTYAKLPASAYGGQKVDWVTPVSAVLANKANASSDRTNAVIALAEIGTSDALTAMRGALLDETDPEIKRLLVYAIRTAEAAAKRSITPNGRSAPTRH